MIFGTKSNVTGKLYGECDRIIKLIGRLLMDKFEGRCNAMEPTVDVVVSYNKEAVIRRGGRRLKKVNIMNASLAK